MAVIVTKVIVYNRMEGGAPQRLNNSTVKLINPSGTILNSYSIGDASGAEFEFI